MKKLLLTGVAVLFLATGAWAFDLVEKMPNDSALHCGDMWLYKLPSGEWRASANWPKGPVPVGVKNNRIYIDAKNVCQNTVQVQ